MDPFIAMVSGGQLLNALLYVVIWGSIIQVLRWGLPKLSLSEPWLKASNVILVVLTVVVLINILLDLIGHPLIRW